MEIYEISNMVVLVGVAIFLFNMVKEENMSFKYGINSFNSKYMPIIVFVLYLIGYKLLEEINFRVYILDSSYFFIIMISIALLASYILKKLIEKITEHKEKFTPSYIKHNFVVILFALYFAFTLLFIQTEDIENSILNVTILKVGSSSIELINIIIIAFLLLTTGSMFNLAQIYNSKKHRLIYDTELNCVLKALNIEFEKEFMDVYLISESKEAIIVKICEEECVSINVKKKYIKGLVFIDENKESYIRKLLANVC